MKAYDALLGVVRDLDLEAQCVPQLPLERDNVRIDRTGGARSGNLAHSAWFDGAGSLFRLTYREALGDDFPSQRFRIGRSGNSARMTHADIASQ